MNGNRVTMKRPKASRIRTVLSKEPIVVQKKNCKEIGRANLLRKFERKRVMNERPRHEYSGPLRRGRRSFLPKRKNVYIYIYIYIYIYGRKKQINYKFIPTSLFRGRPLIRGFNENKLYHRLYTI
mgnify:CR=1 FL=1